jgi:hypothetical protein
LPLPRRALPLQSSMAIIALTAIAGSAINLLAGGGG